MKDLLYFVGSLAQFNRLRGDRLFVYFMISGGRVCFVCIRVCRVASGKYDSPIKIIKKKNGAGRESGSTFIKDLGQVFWGEGGGRECGTEEKQLKLCGPCLEGLLKQRQPGPTLRVFDSVNLRASGKFAFLTVSGVMPIFLFWDHTWNITD